MMGREPQKKMINNTEVASFSVASNKIVGDKSQATWINCYKWNPKGDYMYKIAKGSRIVVIGELEIKTMKGRQFINCHVLDIDVMFRPAQDMTKYFDDRFPEEDAWAALRNPFKNED